MNRKESATLTPLQPGLTLSPSPPRLTPTPHSFQIKTHSSLLGLTASCPLLTPLASVSLPRPLPEQASATHSTLPLLAACQGAPARTLTPTPAMPHLLAPSAATHTPSTHSATPHVPPRVAGLGTRALSEVYRHGEVKGTMTAKKNKKDQSKKLCKPSSCCLLLFTFHALKVYHTSLKV